MLMLGAKKGALLLLYRTAFVRLKLIDPEIMKDILKDMSIYSIPFVEPLIIDTSAMSPDESATVIAESL